MGDGGGALMQTHTFGLRILRCPIIPSSIKFRDTEPVCHGIFIMYLICEGEGGGGGFLRPTTPEACNSTPCNRSQKMSVIFLPLGHG